jgi:elongation factor G
MDRKGADFASVVKQMREKLAAPAIPIQLPIGSEENFKGVVDLITMQALTFKEENLGSEVVASEIPESMAVEAEKARAALIERVAESDEQLIEAYLENPDVPADLLIPALRRATVSGHIVPVLCGSSLKATIRKRKK